MMRALLALACLLTVVPVGADEPSDARRPAAIKTQNVPTVPADIFSRLREYQNIRNALFMSWTPDSKSLLVLTRFGNAPQLHRVAAPLARREQLTFFDEPVMSARSLNPSQDEALLLVMSQGGNENDQLYRLDPHSYRTTLLTDGKSRHLLGPTSRDGKQIVVLHNARNGRDSDIFIADTREPNKQERVFQTEGQFWQVEDWSHDGRYLLMSRYVSINEGYPAILDLKEQKKIDIELRKKPGDKVAISEMRFSPDGQSIYLTHDADGEFLQLVKYDLARKQYQSLTKDIPWDVASVEVDASGTVAFTTNEDGFSRIYLLRDGVRKAVDLPRGLVQNVKFSPDGQHIGFSFSGPTAPADAYSCEIATGKITRWTISESGGLDPSAFVDAKLIRFSTFDGQQVPAFYYPPKGASPQKPVGVLIGIHGGPEAQYRPDFSALAQFYAGRLGIAVIFPNVRGSAGYGKTYLQLDNGKQREDSVKDIGALLDWIRSQQELDSTRVAVTGGSYGGYMVLASLTHYPDRIKAGIDNVGIANWVTFLERTSPYRQDLRRAEYGDERIPDMREFLTRISPANRADKIRSALLVAHGVNDPRVPFSEAQQIAEKVGSLGRSVWTVYADNEGHGFLKKDNRDYLSGVEAVFLLKHLVSGNAP